MSTIPEAIYDVLYVTAKLGEKFGDAEVSEVHLFCYLSCLLSLYQGNLLVSWGYSFISSNLGAPYSSDLDSSINILINAGLLEISGNYLTLTASGYEALNILGTFEQNAKREKCLSAACLSAFTLPFGTLRRGLLNEPVLKNAISLDKTERLLDERNPSNTLLYDQFNLLRESISSKSHDLIIPSTVWLTFLFNKTTLADQII